MGSDEEKKSLSLRLGALHFIDFKLVEDVAKEVMALSDGVGAHEVFVTAAPAYKNALACIGDRIGGCIMAVGLR